MRGMPPTVSVRVPALGVRSRRGLRLRGPVEGQIGEVAKRRVRVVAVLVAGLVVVEGFQVGARVDSLDPAASGALAGLRRAGPVRWCSRSPEGWSSFMRCGVPYGLVAAWPSLRAVVSSKGKSRSLETPVTERHARGRPALGRCGD